MERQKLRMEGTTSFNMVMDYNHITISEATLIQNQLQDKINLWAMDSKIETIAGADISFNKYETTVYAGIIILRFPQMIPIAYSLVKVDVHFPYVSGYLAFREVPALMKAWEQLANKPDVLVVDGHGIAHPRRMGIAAHFGGLTGQTTLGCAKTILCGKFEEPNLDRGSFSPIFYKEEQVGWTLRSKSNVSPVFVSPGNNMDIDDSLNIMQACLGKYRIPEPTRLAHELVNRFRTGELDEGFVDYQTQ